jgi:hypothetical protein
MRLINTILVLQQSRRVRYSMNEGFTLDSRPQAAGRTKFYFRQNHMEE